MKLSNEEIEIEILFYECFLQYQFDNDFSLESITETEATITYLKKLLKDKI